MNILGFSGGVLNGNQDGAAALLRDGRLVAAVEEERLSRVKHAPGRLPTRAIRWCLRQAGLSLADVTAVAFPGATYQGFTEILADYLDDQFGHVPPIERFDHHRSHAAAAFMFQRRDPGIVLTMDFSGDGIATTASVGRDGRLEELWRIAKPNSLGLFYSLLTQYLGFEKDNDEYKVMGLAAFGDPNRFDFSGVLRPEGSTYRLDPSHLRQRLDADRPSPSKQQRLFRGQLGLPRRPRLPNGPIEAYHQDVAASGQRALEQVVLHVVAGLVEQTGIRHLCLAGGVALNCAMNRRLLESPWLDSLSVLPLVSDAGLAIGAAALASLQRGVRPQPQDHFYLGPSYDDQEIQAVLDQCGLPYTRPADLVETVADDLAAGKIVGWFQGAAEFGPRALGHRSILADCRDRAMIDRINAKVKFREAFRPFAPSVLQEQAEAIFGPIGRAPYMTVTYPVRPEQRADVAAITHVDGTARVQTVSDQDDPLYAALLRAVGRRTGRAIVLNTSLNVMGQPMVCSPRDALGTFFSTGLDSLALGPFYLVK